jgi:hypothetical protein
MHQQEKPTGMLEDAKRGFNVLLLLAFVWGTPVQIFCRKFGTWGSRNLSIHFLFGLGWPLLFWEVFCPRDPQWPFLLLAVLMIAGIVLHLVLRDKHDKTKHSQYTGDSICGTGKHATTRECVLISLVGLVAFPVSPGMCAFLIGSGFASGFFHGWIQDRDKARIRAVRDAQLEQEYYMGLYRKEYQS